MQDDSHFKVFEMKDPLKFETIDLQVITMRVCELIEIWTGFASRLGDVSACCGIVERKNSMMFLKFVNLFHRRKNIRIICERIKYLTCTAYTAHKEIMLTLKETISPEANIINPLHT